MSIIHNIKTKNLLDFNRLNQAIEQTIENVKFEYRGGNTFYYWLDKFSARGVDISIEKKNLIEIRNTVMSNRFDYILTNKIAELIISQLGGVIYDGDKDIVDKFPLFDDITIEKNELNDSEIIYFLSNENDMAIFTPQRTVHFGNRLNKELSTLSKANRKNKMFEIIQNCQYNIPEYSYGDVIQVGNDESEDKKILKLLTNKVDCLIDKYDRIMLDRDGRNPIMITNQILNTILPEKWKLYDEYTIAAQELPNEDWELLKNKALTHDIFDDFMKN